MAVKASDPLTDYVEELIDIAARGQAGFAVYIADDIRARFFPKPQVYVYLTDGGILEYEVTKGEVDVIDIDWDENAEYEEEDLLGMRAKLERLPEGALRTAELLGIDHLIEEAKEREAERAVLGATVDQRSKRARAAALLTDAEINGILDAHATEGKD